MDISASRKRRPDLTQEAFERLLAWLDPDRDRAGLRYEEIRSHLIKIFVCRGCTVPEDLADETINRVARKAQEIADAYVGNPAAYFRGVAQLVHLEHLRRKPAALSLPPAIAAADADLKYECLEECMQRLTERSRALILAYYTDDRHAKKDGRKELAERLGIGANALWIRAHRIRESLRECVSTCVNRGSVDR